MRPRALPGPVEAVGHHLVQDVVDQRGFPGPRHAGHAAEDAQRDLHVDVREVVLAGPLDLDVAARPAPALGQLDRPRTRQELPGQRVLDALDLGGGALGHDPAAVLARARPEVDEVVGGAHRALVVLDHDHGVAEIPQALQRADQARVVALVQPDRGLVEDVEHADQRRADLRRQADPLRLAAGQGRGRPLERQVAHPDVVQEHQPLLDLAQDQPGDLPVDVVQPQLRQPLQRPPRREPREFVDRHPVHGHRPGLGLQPRPTALGARTHRHVLLDLLAGVVGVGLVVAALQVGHDALEPRHVGALAPEAVAVGDVDAVPVGAVQEQVALVGRQLLPRLGQVDLVLLGDRRRDLVVVLRRGRRPRQDRAVADRQGAVGHDQVGVDLHLRAQARAARAGPVRRVEREHPRLELGQAGAVLGAGELLGERERLLGVDQLDVDQPVRQRHARLHGVRQPLAQVGPHHEPVHHDRDVVLVLLVQRDVLVELAHLAVDPHASEALAPQLLEQLPVLALAAAHDRREHHEPGAVVQGHDVVDDLLRRLALDRPAADVAVRPADARP